MKPSISSRARILLLILVVTVTTALGCHKRDWIDIFKPGKKDHAQTKTFSSEVILKWMDMNLYLIRTNATPMGGMPPIRIFAYCGVASYESVVPGMPSYQSLSNQLSQMPDMPRPAKNLAYHWPTSANAALSFLNRNFFQNTSEANKASIDSLDNALITQYRSNVNADVFQRSVDFGREVAQRIWDWSKTDGAANANAPYTPPTGPGMWAPTPPAFAPASTPYWGKNRIMVKGSLSGSEQPLPPSYSTDPASPYYAMVKEVYDISQSLTPNQQAIAIYYRDNPGFGGAHYLSVLKQLLMKQQSMLDFSAMAYAKAGIACFDAGIGCYQVKYKVNQERPIRYIREVLNHPDWSPLFGTPAFPDFPSAHSTVSGSLSQILSELFGSAYQFTNRTYDYLGMAPLSYNSFSEFATEIGMSRVYAGIHYRYSCEAGKLQGEKIGQNINAKLRFRKG